MIGYIEDYDPTAGWSEQEWEKWRINETQLAACDILREGKKLTVQDLIDILKGYGYPDDRCRRAILYLLDEGEIILSQVYPRYLLLIRGY
jgi:hypothetical protein